jgi:hypothetical protein
METLLGDDHGSTEILESSGTTEYATNRVFRHAREVFMVRGRSPLQDPTPPNVNSDDETTFATPADALGTPNETKAKKTTRKEKNKQRVGHSIRAASTTGSG